MTAIIYVRVMIVTKKSIFNLRENSKVILNIFFKANLNTYETSIITRDIRENIFITSGMPILKVPVE